MVANGVDTSSSAYTPPIRAPVDPSLCIPNATPRYDTSDPLNWKKAAAAMGGSHLDEVRDMIRTVYGDSKASFGIEGTTLTVAQVAAVAKRGGAAQVCLDSAAAKKRVDESSRWVLDNAMKGTDTYGVTTGFGATSHRRTNQGIELQKELIRFLNAGIFGGEESDTGNVLPTAFARAAIETD